MELKDGSGSDSFSPSIWSLRQFIWFGLDLLLSSGSLWLWLAGRSSQRGLLYSFNVDVAIVCVEVFCLASSYVEASMWLFCGSVRLLFSFVVGSAYSSLQQNFHYVLPWWGSPWGIEAAFGLSGFAILWKMFCYSQWIGGWRRLFWLPVDAHVPSSVSLVRLSRSVFVLVFREAVSALSWGLRTTLNLGCLW